MVMISNHQMCPFLKRLSKKLDILHTNQPPRHRNLHRSSTVCHHIRLFILILMNESDSFISVLMFPKARLGGNHQHKW